MNPLEFAPIYIAVRFAYRIVDFFHHWYVDGTRAFLQYAMFVLHELNRTFAVFVTFKHFFEPLYKDYSVPGRVWGVVFRAGRVILGIGITLCFAVMFLTAYALWILLPPLTIIFSANSVPFGVVLVGIVNTLSAGALFVIETFLSLFSYGY